VDDATGEELARRSLVPGSEEGDSAQAK
jgi:hypothetical protein